MLTITVTITIIPFLPLLRFSQLFLPDVVGSVGVQVREDKVEDVGIPARGVAVDAFFDVLLQSPSAFAIIAQHMRLYSPLHGIYRIGWEGVQKNSPPATQSNRSYYPWGK